MMTMLLIYSIILFPGYNDKYEEWFYGQFIKIRLLTKSIWILINLVSTAVTVFAVIWLLQTIKTLRRTNQRIDLNKNSLILHSILLVIQSTTAILDTSAYYLSSSRVYGGTILLETLADLVLQLVICYICLTIGSDV